METRRTRKKRVLISHQTHSCSLKPTNPRPAQGPAQGTLLVAHGDVWTPTEDPACSRLLRQSRTNHTWQHSTLTNPFPESPSSTHSSGSAAPPVMVNNHLPFLDLLLLKQTNKKRSKKPHPKPSLLEIWAFPSIDLAFWCLGGAAATNSSLLESHSLQPTVLARKWQGCIELHDSISEDEADADTPKSAPLPRSN